jgi:hypothetical protein
MLDDRIEERRREVDEITAAARLCAAASRIKRGAATPEERAHLDSLALQRARKAVHEVLGIPSVPAAAER